MSRVQRELGAASTYLKRQCPFDTFPETAVVLGSGFKHFAQAIEIVHEIEFREIPYFIAPKVQGHGSSLCFARSAEKEIVVLTGRIHLYEGHTPYDVVFAVRALASSGIKNLVLTNAAGGLDAALSPGDVLVLEDHINLTGMNCLVGDTESLGKRFVDMTNCYDKEWREKILKLGGTKPGIYVGLLGCTYETPAETRYYARSGANAVGMSTVLECIAARQMNIKVAALSFVTNLAAGLSDKVDHQEVLDIGKSEAPRLAKILAEVCQLA
jgi:purine-nucleoside phosphorylase